MKVIGDHDNIVRVACSRCSLGPLGPGAVAAVGRGEVKVLCASCVPLEIQFLASEGGARTLTLAELVGEISDSLGV
jgi:hypothetical protein